MAMQYLRTVCIASYSFILTCVHMINFFLHTVPIPTVNVTLLGDQTLDQLSPTLQCSVITVRGVNSNVDIVWYSSNGTRLQRVNDATPMIMDYSKVYIDTYVVSSQLSIDFDGNVYLCEAVIDSDPKIRTNNTIALDVIGEMHIQTYSMHVFT